MQTILQRFGAASGIAFMLACAATVSNAQGSSYSPPYPPAGR
jgi:hypothetical protein